MRSLVICRVVDDVAVSPGNKYRNRQAARVTPPRAAAAGLTVVIYLGLVPSALGFVLWGFAAARLSTATLTSLLYLVPPVAVLIAWIWLREVPTLVELAGGLLVLCGVVIVTRGSAISSTLRRPTPASAVESDPTGP